MEQHINNIKGIESNIIIVQIAPCASLVTQNIISEIVRNKLMYIVVEKHLFGFPPPYLHHQLR